VAAALRDADVDVAFRDFGIERRFLDHATRTAVLAGLGLTAQDVSRAVVETVARLDHRAQTRSAREPHGRAAEVERSGDAG
jgi:1-deoxy-D-xylulose-5-phosphate synthase